MTWKKLKEISVPHSYCLTLDRFFPKTLRHFLRHGAALAALVSFSLSFNSLPLYFSNADALFFLFIFIFVLLSFLEFFYKSMLGEGVHPRIKESLLDDNQFVDYALSQIIFNTDEIDATRALFETNIGLHVLLRCGIHPSLAKDFIHLQRTPIIASSLELRGESVNLLNYSLTLYDADKSFSDFLSKHSVGRDDFGGALDWVMHMEDKKRRKDRFWSRENLGALPSIGTSWSYGVATDLGKFGIPFEDMTNISALDVENGYRDEEVKTLENILERRAEANAIIVDDDQNVARDIVGRLLKKIKLGIALPSVEHKNIIELDSNALIATYKNRGELEAEFLKLLDQSISAGNIILYINDLAGLASSVKALGINLGSLLSPYLAGRELQIVASAANADFHFFIETNPTLLERFERIIPEKAGVEASINPLLEQALSIERQYGFIFSYPSILALANTADRYVTYGEMPGKALDMQGEIATWASARKIGILREEEVTAFASEKTGIATGPVKEKEASKIEHLEELLHKRVVGQNEAVEGVASAVRRARSGVGNPKRPLSSFLFIGPTGVGKTEVSKALAESFFGDENKMIRFDMSEYNGPEALSRLIGDFALNKSGILASKIRDNPYSVLLLDEFEKSAPDVLDLFLQILDEGVFTDALGRQVGCRNNIIIATSNAGASLIWEITKSGADLVQSKDKIVDTVIKDKIFRPELLNRFDGVILFHPLKREELRKIAVLGLEKLAKRLKDQNIEFVINDEVVDFLVEKGGDPQFGARAINRAIQDVIEDTVAKKIISGEAKAGSKVEIKREELV